MPILAAVCEAESGGITHTGRGSIHHLSDEREGADRFRSNARYGEELLEVLRIRLVGRKQHLAQMGGIHVLLDVDPVTGRQRHRDHARDLPVYCSRFLSGEIGGHRSRRRRFGRDHVENGLPGALAGDGSVWLVHEIFHLRAEPMVAACSAVVDAHALLHNGPFAVGRDEEAVMIDAETILDRGGIDFGSHPTVVGEARAVDAGTRAVLHKLDRRASRDFSFATSDEYSELVAACGEAFLQRTADCRRHPARVPIESEHTAK